jgi:hypothetical protein
MKMEEVIAREAIRHTVGIYNSAVDRNEYRELASVFVPNGIIKFAGNASLQGHESIIFTMLEGAKRRGDFEIGNFQRHLLGNSMINIVDGENARAVHYIVVATEAGLDHGGVYVDDFVKVGESWLIATRNANLEWINPGSRFAGFSGPHPMSADELNIWGS